MCVCVCARVCSCVGVSVFVYLCVSVFPSTIQRPFKIWLIVQSAMEIDIIKPTSALPLVDDEKVVNKNIASVRLKTK